ncbi:hypothetical protein PTNB73_03167 [Pyrenophora teres f. teres]|nr:hypothetical protein HRS9139_03197 [Pyrenophora teres f. teres]CAA9962266.1 hypothetical protein PTMSG1_05642 [Pyrenophora teres f. maculata]KAE8844779.1 hypothetical protein PTNB85_03044 [Pyrenophora teres f. teres]KAE8847019.1 hypothetical protein HRS9122_03926 [Pyrenophora teres f. teres]KAE8866073.1 hypothetical protein PTNB29_03220 [Pyrenophora teres f. teres]
MDVALNRKRSRLTLDDDDEEGRGQLRREPSPVPAPALGDPLKRSKTHCELEELDVIDAAEAWNVHVQAILASSTLATPTDSRLVPYDNWARYRKDESIVVLCVQGNVQVHYELLCAALPDLLTLSPSLQAFVLCHDPPTHRISPSAPFSLPLIQAATPSNNHFVRLGLLHPLGGGKFPLDALVVLDGKGRRRLVLPIVAPHGVFVAEMDVAGSLSNELEKKSLDVKKRGHNDGQASKKQMA